MAYPKYKDVCLPLLHYIHSAGGEVPARQTYEPLADLYDLSQTERRQRNPNYPSMVVWWNRVQWARQYLKDDGFLRSSSRGIWQVTDDGREELQRRGLLDRPFPAPLDDYVETAHEQSSPPPDRVVLPEDEYKLWESTVEFAEDRAEESGVFPMTYQEISELAGGSGYGATLIAPLEKAGLIEQVGKRFLDEEEDPLQTPGGRMSSLWRLNQSLEVVQAREGERPGGRTRGAEAQSAPEAPARPAVDLPKCSEIAPPLLHFTADRGGVIRTRDAIDSLADFFELPTDVRKARYDSNPNTRRWDSRVHTAMQTLKNNGLVVSAGWGLWKVTTEGERDLRRRGLLGRPFPDPRRQAYAPGSSGGDAGQPSSERETVHRVVSEILANGVLCFPDDFLPESTDSLTFRSIEVPPVMLRLAPHSSMKIVAPGLPFRYECRNPVEAAYILFSHEPGERSVQLPCGNLLQYRMVSDYRQYVRRLQAKILDRLAEITLDGHRAADLARHVYREVGLPEEI